MRNYPKSQCVAIGLLMTLLLLVSCSSVPPQTPEERVAMLQAQVRELDRQLLVMHEADGAEQRLLMQLYWRTLQIQLTYVRNLPGVEAHDCADWTLQDPMSGAFAYSKPCPTLHDEGPAAGLPFPDQLSPTLFQLMMHQELNTLSAQVDVIAAETSRTARQDLIRQHYETRYRDLQTVLGRDWMWTPRKEADLPDPDSLGATLFTQYCGQCHNPPPPGINTPAQWGYVTERMSHIIEGQAHSGAMGVNLPSADEFQAIAQYLMMHGFRPGASK